jgi:hypothetical protein
MTSGKHRKNRHSCGMGAGHLDQESAFDLVFGLRVFDESQAGVHGYLGKSAARQFGGRD